MRRGSVRYRLALPLAVTVLIICAQLFPAPALSDPVSGAAPAALHLVVPRTYLILAPLFTLWDGVSMLSMSRLRGLLIGLVLLYLIWRMLRRITRSARAFSWIAEIRILAVSLGLFAGFLIIGALWHRPMLALAGTGPMDLVVDFHSHTNASHDVRNTWMRGFDAEANRRWHARAGFQAAFITDHNTVAGQPARDNGSGPVLCPGIEVSAWRAHIVLLGDTLPINQNRYNRSLDSLLSLLRVSDTAYGALSLASLPEYRRNHWGRLDTLAGAGLDGFEIVNASPKANELTRAERDSVVKVARDSNRFVVGVSDSHGWGATSMVWNVVGVTASQPRAAICSAVLSRLRDGFPAVRIIERYRLRPDGWWPVWLTPLGVIWETWRGMEWQLTAPWLAWIWASTLVGLRLRRRRRHR
ncbi:MAG: PHP domain-containing protein [Gemmatimonadales bacterium]